MRFYSVASLTTNHFRLISALKHLRFIFVNFSSYFATYNFVIAMIIGRKLGLQDLGGFLRKSEVSSTQDRKNRQKKCACLLTAAALWVRIQTSLKMNKCATLAKESIANNYRPPKYMQNLAFAYWKNTGYSLLVGFQSSSSNFSSNQGKIIGYIMHLGHHFNNFFDKILSKILIKF